MIEALLSFSIKIANSFWNYIVVLFDGTYKDFIVQIDALRLHIGCV